MVRIFVLLALALTLTACQPTQDEMEEQVMREIVNSSIEGNVPDAIDFHPFLKRDLQGHLSARLKKPVAVEYEFLREGPTQTGIGFPKFFLWVTSREAGVTLEQGACVVAAEDKKRFVVREYLEASTIKMSPKAVYAGYPGPVADRIIEKARAGPHPLRPKRQR